MNLSKRNITYFLLIMIFLISGCGGGSASSATEESSVNTTTQTATTQTATTQTATTQTATTQTANTQTANTQTATTQTATTQTATTQTTNTVTPTTTSNPVTIKPSNKATHSGQVKDSKTGNGLADVKVSLGDATTITDENGFYTFSNLTESKEVVVNFEKGGYLHGSTQIQLKSLSGDNTDSPNYLEYNMLINNNQWDYNSNDEINGNHIMIDASVSYRDINGKPYSGTITAALTYFDITSDVGKAAFPGAFKGINSNGTLVQFDTYGLISMLLEDSNGDRLSLTEGETVILGFDAVSSLDKPDTLPLWYYDYNQGLWFEEGYAQLQEDGTYKGEVSHLGTWSVNKALEDEPGIYRGHIVDENGSPMSNVRLHALGENWVSSDLTTDVNGLFEIEVIPGSSFKLSAFDYKDKFGANYDGIISAIASGDIVEEQ